MADIKISRMLRKRYILALSIIAILLLLSQLVIQVTIALQEDDSRIINIAGRQRMLSQKINKAAFGLYISTTAGQDKRYYAELQNALALWGRSNNGLLHGDSQLGLPGNNSPKVRQMFTMIEPPYSKITQATNQILNLHTTNRHNKKTLLPFVMTIQANEQDFLQGMDKIVFQYDTESKQKTNRIRLIEILILICTLMTISLEALFIFRPAEKQIDKAVHNLEDSQASMQKLFETAPAAMFLLDANDFSILKLNKLAQGILTMSGQEKSDLNQPAFMPDNKAEISRLAKMISIDIPIQNAEAIIKTTDNHSLIVLLSSSIINYDNKKTIILGLSDITQMKEAEDVLKRYATIDEMTGFLNKRSGMLVLSNCFERAKTINEEITICFSDINSLKAVNDDIGHEEGDFYIKTVAQAIKNSLKSNDTVFRYGGDEIVMIFEACSKIEATSIVQRINDNLTKLASKADRPYEMSLSCGIASRIEDDISTEDDILKSADQAMYIAKRIHHQRKNAK